MIKLSANVSKKVPIPEMEYSSQNFSAGMEVEVSSNTTRGELKDKYQDLYEILSECIEEQIQNANGSGVEAPQPQAQVPARQKQSRQRHRAVQNRSGGNGGNGRRGSGKKATEAQARAVFAIARSRGYELQEVLTPYGVSSPYQLSIGDASTLIDSLKNGNGGA